CPSRCGRRHLSRGDSVTLFLTFFAVFLFAQRPCCAGEVLIVTPTNATPTLVAALEGSSDGNTKVGSPYPKNFIGGSAGISVRNLGGRLFSKNRGSMLLCATIVG